MASTSVTNLGRGATSINFRRALISSTQSPSRRNVKSDFTVQTDMCNESPSLGRRRSLTNIFLAQNSCHQIKKNHWDEANLRRQSSLTCLHTQTPNSQASSLERSHPGVVFRKKPHRASSTFDIHRRFSMSGSLLDHVAMNDEPTIQGSLDNLTFTKSVVDRRSSSGSIKINKGNSTKSRHSSYIPETTFLSRPITSRTSGLRSADQRRHYNSMANLKFEKPEDNESDHSEYGTAIGAAATATAAAIAMLIRDSPKVQASEANDDDNDSADLATKCQITRETNVEKIYQGKGSFILQDLYTNALYLIQHDTKTTSNEERADPEHITDNVSTYPDDNNNSNPEVAKPTSNIEICDDPQDSVDDIDHNENNLAEPVATKELKEGPEAVCKDSEMAVTIKVQGDSQTKTQPKHVKLVRRGSGRTLNASTLTSLMPFGNKSEESSVGGANLQSSNDENEIEPRLKHGGGEEDEDEDEDVDTTDKKGNGKKKERIGFRDRKIMDYENRIRAYSTPDKIFRYFATYKSTQDSEIYMTPEDFLRSLTPGVKQPDGLGLDHFQKFDPETMSVKNLSQNLPEDSIFYKLGKSGLVSFSDYVFMLTILSTSRRQFEIAFRMFDLNGDGDVDAEEFEQVQNIIRQTTTMGSRHRDHSTTGNTLKGINSALAVYFFGDKLDGKLTIDRFLEFQQDLQTAILTLEFQRKDPDDEGKITEKHFAELILTYADYSPKKRSATLKRVKKKYKDKKPSTKEPTDPLDTTEHGIFLEDYIQIFSVLIHIDDVDKALSFYNLAGASIDKTTLKHVAKVCAGVELREHLVDVLFTIFDEDGDGVLSNKEFVSVMKNKLKRGLEKPKDIGIVNLFSAVAKCAKSTPIPAAPTLVFTPH